MRILFFFVILLNVLISFSQVNGFVDGQNDFLNDYAYSSRGNRVADRNNQVSEILYNQFDKTTSYKSHGSNITAVYDAKGRKLQQTFRTGNTSQQNTYINRIIYTENSLNKLKTSQVEINFVGNGNSTNTYSIKDQNNNVRAEFLDYNLDGKLDNTAEVIVANSYYPFGAKFQYRSKINNSQPCFSFNAKEEIPKFGLLDFEARLYEPLLGSWLSIDPENESYKDWNGYNFIGNNPIKRQDPDGKDWIIRREVDADGNLTYHIHINLTIYNSSSKKLGHRAADIVSATRKQHQRSLEIDEIYNGVNVKSHITTDIHYVSYYRSIKENATVMEFVDGKYLGAGTLGQAKLLSDRFYLNVDYIDILINDGTLGYMASTIVHEDLHAQGIPHSNMPEGKMEKFVNRNYPDELFLAPGVDDNNIMLARPGDGLKYGEPSGVRKINPAQLAYLYEVQNKIDRDHFINIPAFGKSLRYPRLLKLPLIDGVTTPISRSSEGY